MFPKELVFGPPQNLYVLGGPCGPSWTHTSVSGPERNAADLWTWGGWLSLTQGCCPRFTARKAGMGLEPPEEATAPRWHSWRLEGQSGQPDSAWEWGGLAQGYPDSLHSTGKSCASQTGGFLQSNGATNLSGASRRAP